MTLKLLFFFNILTSLCFQYIHQLQNMNCDHLIVLNACFEIHIFTSFCATEKDSLLLKIDGQKMVVVKSFLQLGRQVSLSPISFV